MDKEGTDLFHSNDNADQEGSDEITLTVKDIQGEEVEIKIKKTDQVKELIKKYRNLKNVVNSSQVLLYYGGKSMKEDMTLKELNVEDGETIHCSIRLKGGKI